MSTKSDFAQKLLHDLRIRKERMAATQNTGRQSSQTSSRDMRGNTGRTNKGSRQINAPQSAGSSTGNTSRRSYGGNKSMNTKESSNQIVLYEGGQSSRQVRDLSMAIAFAFENSGNLSKIGASSSNPLVNFFNRFGRRSMKSQKISFDNESFSNYQFPSVSNIHISEISKGVQKLNQILKACSNGLNLDRNSIELGKELLKGAIDLEESLRMLANMNSTRQKNRIKLLDEDEDEQDNNDKTAETWKLGRPRFSFDGPSRDNRKKQQLALSYVDELYEQPISNSKMVPYNARGKVQNNSSSSQSSQEKGISNVIAKLMGLEELPQKESTRLQNNPKGKASRINSKLSEPLSRDRKKEDPLVRDSKKILETPDASSKVAYSDKKQPRDDLKILKGGINAGSNTKLATTVRNKLQNQVIVPNRVDGLQIGGEKNTIETSNSKTLVSNIKVHKKAENSKTVKNDDKTHNRIEYKVSANYLEKRNSIQEHVLKRTEHIEDKHHAEQKGRNQIAKKHESRQAEYIIEPKPKKSAPIDAQKKLSREKFTPDCGTKPTRKVPKKDPPNKDAPIIDSSHKTAVNRENLDKDDEKHNSSPIKPQFDTEKKSIEVSATQKKVISKKIQESESPRKIDVMMSKRNVRLNHLARSGKQSDSMLKDLKQHMHKRSNVKEEKGGVKAMKHPENFSNEDDQITTLNISFPDESQIQSILEMQTPNDNCDAIASKFEKDLDDLQTMEQTYAFKDEHELKQISQTNGHEQSMELYNLGHPECNQCPASTILEQLTEPEKELKEIAVKNPLFLSTAEALFKLNIPVTFLHAADQDNETGEKKLVLDCAYEAMKRKARRNEAISHPYMKTSISCAKVRSLDDLVKQLCKDLEMLKIYGGNGIDIVDGLQEMLNKDLYNINPDINSMWDFDWSKMVSILPEKEDVIRDVEKHMLNGLLDEITTDLHLITISV